MQIDTSSISCQNDPLDPGRARALCAALDLPDTVSAGDAMPPFFHQIYFWDAQAPEHLGRDGHPKTGGLIPDRGLPRRMWAGGRLRFHAPLIAGHPAEKRSFCENVAEKTGRSGPLALVTLKHELHQNGRLCISEWQDLVYREDPSPQAAKPVAPKAPEGAETEEDVSFDTTLLFRYSALTFNGHRIHYDLDYAQGVEGYQGLVVHGPLLAQLLMLKAQRELGPLTAFNFRATAPLMHFETATLCRTGKALWVRGPEGRQCMSAEATAASQ